MLQKIYQGQAYTLGDRLWLCLYHPERDLHFPLSTPQASLWRVVTWCIAGTATAATAYAVIMAPRSAERLNPETEIGTVDLVTQFNTISVAVTRPRPFSEAGETVRAAMLFTLLRSLGEEDGETVISTLSEIGNAMKAIDVSEFLRGDELADPRPRLSLPGLVPARYVLSLEEAPLRLRAVDAVDFVWADGNRTDLQLTAEVPPGRLLLLGRSGYHLAIVQ